MTTIEGFNLPTVADARYTWENSRPFPHIVTLDVIGPEVAAIVGDGFPPPDSTGWHTFTGPLEEGKQEGTAAVAGPAVAVIHDWLACDDFIDWLRAVTSIPDLLADPDRVGGGIHQSDLGARLGLHVDFNVHPRRPDLVRAVNLILFVGDHDRWDAAWGGLLELGAGGMPVFPMPGTLVIFESSDTSWHGHPVPMQADQRDGTVPPLRKSIPAYYYRPIREGEQIEAHSTRFMET